MTPATFLFDAWFAGARARAVDQDSSFLRRPALVHAIYADLDATQAAEPRQASEPGTDDVDAPVARSRRRWRRAR
jgi:hypothetical protein